MWDSQLCTQWKFKTNNVKKIQNKWCQEGSLQRLQQENCTYTTTKTTNLNFEGHNGSRNIPLQFHGSHKSCWFENENEHLVASLGNLYHRRASADKYDLHVQSGEEITNKRQQQLWATALQVKLYVTVYVQLFSKCKPAQVNNSFTSTILKREYNYTKLQRNKNIIEYITLWGPIMVPVQDRM